MDIKEYFQAKIDRKNTLLGYQAVIDSTEYDTVCDYDGCKSVKKKIVGITPRDFKRFKSFVNNEYQGVKASIDTIHDMVRYGWIQPWEGYNPKEHGENNMGAVKSDMTITEVHKKWWEESREDLKRQDEKIKWAMEYDRRN